MTGKTESGDRHAERRRIALRNLFLFSAFCSLLFLTACSRKSGGSDKVLAKVGSKELTKGMLTALVGVPADSLKAPDRVRMIEAWVERTMVDLEGQRRHLEKDPVIIAKLASVRSELYRSRLLSDLPAPPPPDTAIDAYYEAHRQDFLRPMDVYSIELYWAPTDNLMSLFREQIMHGDTSMVTAGDVTFEGRWLAEAGEMDEDLQREVTSLKPGEVTFPHPYEDGFRVVRLQDIYPAGTVLDRAVVRDEIASRLMIVQSRRREDSLMTELRKRYPVTIVADSL